MYTTPLSDSSHEAFDWNSYFKPVYSAELLPNYDATAILTKARQHIKENSVRASFVLTLLLRNLLENVPIKKNPTILELGAGTGFLTRWLLEKYGGMATLVDNNMSSYKAFKSLKSVDSYQIDYVIENIFTFETPKRFDIVCSFGLVEHFKDKQKIIETHRKYLSTNGYMIILVPLDSCLSRIYWEIYPELNLGYRELLSETDFINIFKMNQLHLLKTEKSFGHSYDIIAGICTLQT